MSFAGSYFERYPSGPALFTKAPHPDLSLIVIIPAHRELGIEKVVDQLISEQAFHGRLELLILFNASEKDQELVHKENAEAYAALQAYLKSRKIPYDWDVHVALNNQLPHRHAGVGLARKLLMDEALRRFNQHDKPDGVIVSYDADTLCEPGFIQAIQQAYYRWHGLRAANHHFEHPIQGTEFPREVYEGIIGYELYLRYYHEALKRTSFPFPHFTIGSAFSFRAHAYMAVGGMNKRKAGEDFYFIHKLLLGGEFGFIPEAIVYPSPRPSDRVPFGTGKAIQQFIDSGEEKVYSPESFEKLSLLIKQIEELYPLSQEDVSTWLTHLPIDLRDFLESVSFLKEIEKIRSNVSSPSSFRKRFFHWFNGLMVLRFLNFDKNQYSPGMSIEEAARALAGNLGWNIPPLGKAKELLLYYREVQKKTPLP